MIGALILLILYLVLLGVFVWGVRKIISVIPMDATIANVINVVIVVVSVLVAVILVMNFFLPLIGVQSPLPAP